MSSISLHDMPKDMLIKLIATIREDTIQETFKDTMKLVEEGLNSNHNHKYQPLGYLKSCKHSNCKYFEISGYHQFHKDLKECDRCDNLLCSKHLPKNNEKCHDECTNKRSDLYKTNFSKIFNHGFILREDDDENLIVICIEEKGIRRNLTDDEKKIVLDMGLKVL